MSLDFLKSPVFMRVCAGCANGNEATGNLDSYNTEMVLNLFVRLKKMFSLTVMIATHDYAVAKRADHLIVLQDGKVQRDVYDK